MNKMRYFVIDVMRGKKKENKLMLVESNCREMVRDAFEYVKDNKKLPFIEQDDVVINNIFDLSNPDQFRELMMKHVGDIIYFKIRYSSIGTYFLSDTYIQVEDIAMNDRDVTAVHIQSKGEILRDSNIENKYKKVNELIRTSIVKYSVNFTVFETGMMSKWDKWNTDSFRTILQNNDLGVIFHNATLDDVKDLSTILFTMCEQKLRWLYLFYVDNDNNLYKIEMSDKMEIIPVKG